MYGKEIRCTKFSASMLNYILYDIRLIPIMIVYQLILIPEHIRLNYLNRTRFMSMVNDNKNN